MKGLIGKKIGMTQVFDGDGNMVPVTIIDTTSCIVVGKRTAETDKYTAVTLGFGEAKEKKLNKPDAGHVK
jgi:large subunit ribosomal protein L3